MLYNSICMSDGKKILASNKKALFNYFVEESVECGVVLEGSEVKSIKAGLLSFPDSFAEIINGEVWAKNFHVSEYSFSSAFSPDPDRPKKLLLKKDQIKRLERKTAQKGFTLVPLDVHLKNGFVKVTLGLCKGKKQFDKRDATRERDIDREARRDVKARFR